MFLLPKCRNISEFRDAWSIIIAGEDRSANDM
jgi:hypothetical protein